MKNLAYGASFAIILAAWTPSYAVALVDDETSNRPNYVICTAYTDSNGRYDSDHSGAVALFLMRLDEKPKQQLKDMAQDFGKAVNAIAQTNKYFSTYGQRNSSCSSSETEEGVQAAAQYFRFRHSAHTQRPIVKWMPPGATGLDGTLGPPAPRMPDPGLVISNSASTSTSTSPPQPNYRSPPAPRSAPVQPKSEPGRKSTCQKYCGRPI